jgi:hypothetical protein
MVCPVFGDGWAFDAWCARTREYMDAYLEASIAGGGPLHLLADLLFTLICWQCLHHGFGSLHTSQFVGGLFARFAGISLGPDPQGTRQQDTKQHHHKTGHRKKSKQPTKKKKGFAAGMVHGIQIRRIRKMKKKGGQVLRVGKEKVTLIFDGMLFPIGCANIPHNKQPIEKCSLFIATKCSLFLATKCSLFLATKCSLFLATKCSLFMLFLATNARSS